MSMYAKRDFDDQDLFEWYLRHLHAMTDEALHSKSDIAAELAYRDQRIAALEQKYETPKVA